MRWVGGSVAVKARIEEKRIFKLLLLYIIGTRSFRNEAFPYRDRMRWVGGAMVGEARIKKNSKLVLLYIIGTCFF